MSELQILFRATLSLYADCARDATRALWRNWTVLAAGFGLSLALGLVSQLFSRLGPSGGFLLGLAEVAALSLYFSWLHGCCQRERLTFRTLWSFDVQLFFAVMGVCFVLWIAELLVGSFAATPQQKWLPVLVRMLIVVLLNSLPESVYVHRYDGINAIRHSFEFTRANWIEWYVPFAIMLAPVMLVSWRDALTSLAGAHPLLPAAPLLQTPSAVLPGASLLALLLGVVLVHWFMLFRGFLFSGLESGGRRKRAFQWRQSGGG